MVLSKEQNGQFSSASKFILLLSAKGDAISFVIVDGNIYELPDYLHLIDNEAVK